MTIANWLAILIPIVGLIGGAIVYQVQRSIDRVNKLKEERRLLYRQLVGQFNRFNYEALRRKSDEALGAFLTYKEIEAEVLVCAPDEVVSALKSLAPLMTKYAAATFKDGSANREEVHDELKAAYESAVKAMRVDVLGKTKITVSMIADFAQGFVVSIGSFPR